MLVHGVEFPDGTVVQTELRKDVAPIDQENGQRRWQVQLIRLHTHVTYGDISFVNYHEVPLAEEDYYMQDDYDAIWLERLLRQTLMDDGHIQVIRDELDAAIAEAADGV